MSTPPVYSRDDLLAWAAGPEEALFAEAARRTRDHAPRLFDRCSIVNGKGGRCPEDCKWCAQSAHHRAACDVHGLISPEECLRHARANEAAGIRRFSIVNSGRRPTPAELDGVCDLVRLLRRETSLELPSSPPSAPPTPRPRKSRPSAPPAASAWTSAPAASSVWAKARPTASTWR